MLIEISHLNDAQVDDLLQMYQVEWWTRGRKREDVQEMLKHSDQVVAFCDSETGQLVAFARILTDYVYRGLIFDVIVNLSYRGQGVGRKLMESILDRPELAKVGNFGLFGILVLGNNINYQCDRQPNRILGAIAIAA
ncbi:MULTISPECIES: GNAT family N-acetyltransferase [Spirulina sp. CCY15215]|uniref:GNAT family N-acetyltransferase n=1 Tax=Spirulina sp. CCY15215 TaxID=2767591 RepID=UPI00194E4F77